MTSLNLPFVLPWGAFAVTWLSLGILVLGAYRLLSNPLRRIEPVQRSLILFAIALLPLSAALVVVVLGFLPHIGGVIVGDHCHTATGCGSHVPVFRTDIAAASLWTLIISLSIGVGIWVLAAVLRRSMTIGRTLDLIAEPMPGFWPQAGEFGESARPVFKVIESPRIFAYCSGLVRSRLLISRGLLENLSPRQVEAVLAHERAHARRRDNLRRLLVSVSLWPLPRRWRQSLLDDLAAATEGACDLEAARILGNREFVANAIRAVAEQSGLDSMRLASPETAASGYSLHSLDVRLASIRAGAMLQFPYLVAVLLIFAAYAATSIVSTRVAHHVAEFFVG